MALDTFSRINPWVIIDGVNMPCRKHNESSWLLGSGLHLSWSIYCQKSGFSKNNRFKDRELITLAGAYRMKVVRRHCVCRVKTCTSGLGSSRIWSREWRQIQANQWNTRLTQLGSKEISLTSWWSCNALLYHSTETCKIGFRFSVHTSTLKKQPVSVI
jgi:hypothetical protein